VRWRFRVGVDWSRGGHVLTSTDAADEPRITDILWCTYLHVYKRSPKHRKHRKKRRKDTDRKECPVQRAHYSHKTQTLKTLFPQNASTQNRTFLAVFLGAG